MIENIEWIIDIPYLFFPLVLGAAYLLFKGTHFVLARGAYFIAFRTETIYDDLFVDQLQPFRFAWLVPITLVYIFTDILFPTWAFVKDISLVIGIWLLADLLVSILNGINDVYKSNPRYTGVSAAGYIGLLKVLVVVGAIVLTISQLIDVDPLTLLSGVGAWLAVLLLIFRDTILSFLASIQISTQQLIREGDTVDIPAFGASGAVKEIDLQTITIQNFDNTVTSIPTSSIVNTGFKNSRSMLESGHRRLKKSIPININTLKFADLTLYNHLQGVPNINELIGDQLNAEDALTTNLELFISYATAYIKQQKEVRKRRYPVVVRTLEPFEGCLPVEIYLFVKADTWAEFEGIQSKIYIHLIAIMKYFDLKN